ncbi:MAG: hypothetical protein HY836_10160 [Aquabacterium sp.]|nr:hypothetical protein [Aquabacterium sp.]
MTAMVILLSAIAPAVSRWLATHHLTQGSAVPSAEVCVSREGLPSIIVIKPMQEQPAHHAWLDHCPLCVMQGDHAGMPPAQMAALPLTGLQHEVPRLFLDAPGPMPIWAPAQARAPPVAQA